MSRTRAGLVFAAILLAVTGLATRLVYLQVFRVAHYRKKAERRRRSLDVLTARRGRILDRHGEVLAVDQPEYQLCVSLTTLDPTLDLAFRLARGVGLGRSEIAAKVRLARRHARIQDRFALLVERVPAERRDRVQRLISKLEYRLKRDHAGLEFADDPSGAELLRWIPPGSIAVAMPLLRRREETLIAISRVLNIPAAELAERIDERVDEILAYEDVYERLAAWSTPFVLQPRISFESALALEERLFELPGVKVRKRFRRYYPQKDSASHLVGYTRAMPAEVFRRLVDDGRVLDVPHWYFRREARAGRLKNPLFPTDALLFEIQNEIPEGTRLRDDEIGRRGLEATNDDRLAGTPGVLLVERDASGRTLGVLGHIPEDHGRDLTLTLDLGLQRVAEQALDRAVKEHGTSKAGAGAVMLDVRSGEVLVLAGAPRFDPNRVSEDYTTWLESPRTPLVFRATSAMPPGSTFKILSALAFFDPKGGQALPIDKTYHCIGRLFRNHRRYANCDGVHGYTDVVNSLEHSCNVFFWRGVRDAGYDSILTWSERLGFGEPVGSDIPGEGGGQIPTEAMKKRRLRIARQGLAHWRDRLARLEDQLESAKRQGAEPDKDLVAEHDLARRKVIYNEDWTRRCEGDQTFTEGNARNAAIGQGDVLANPIQIARLAAFIGNGGVLVTPHIVKGSPAPKRRIPVNEVVLRRIQRGLRQVVLSGTASRRSIGLRELEVAGKTGTAERRRDEPMYAWFMGYYPASKPEVAFAVVIDSTEGHGGGVAGPVARELVKAWQLRGKQARLARLQPAKSGRSGP